MKTCKTTKTNERGEIITSDGRIFRPLYKGMLDKMPADIVHKLAKRRLAELDDTSESDDSAKPTVT